MKTDAIVKLVLIFFISLLSFSIGTFVGKKFSDNQVRLTTFENGQGHDTEATAAHAGAATEEGHRETASINEHAETAAPGKAFTDEQIAKMADEFVTEDKKTETSARGESGEEDKHAANTHGTPAADPHTTNAGDHGAVAETATANHGEKPSAAAARVANDKTPNNPHALVETATPELPKQLAANYLDKFTVQVASYSSEEEAKKLAQDLKKSGYQTFYIPAEIKGQTWYRVNVGLFATQKEAQDYKGTLLSSSKVSSAIVQKITR